MSETPTTAPTWTYNGMFIGADEGHRCLARCIDATDDEMRLMASAPALRDALRDAGKFARHDDHCQRRLMVSGWQPDDPEPQCVCGFAEVAERANDLLSALPVLDQQEK